MKRAAAEAVVDGRPALTVKGEDLEAIAEAIAALLIAELEAPAWTARERIRPNGNVELANPSQDGRKRPRIRVKVLDSRATGRRQPRDSGRSSATWR